MLEKRSLGTLKRTNSEDSLNERFKDNIKIGTDGDNVTCQNHPVKCYAIWEEQPTSKGDKERN